MMGDHFPLPGRSFDVATCDEQMARSDTTAAEFKEWAAAKVRLLEDQGRPPTVEAAASAEIARLQEALTSTRQLLANVLTENINLKRDLQKVVEVVSRYDSRQPPLTR